MGEIEGHRGVWAYAEGGMGAVSAAIARSALSEAAHIAVNAVRCMADAWHAESRRR